MDTSRGDRIALSLEALVETRMRLLEGSTVESDGDAGADHHLVGGAVVGAVTHCKDLCLGGIDQFAKDFQLGVEGGVIVYEFDDLGAIAHDVFDVLLISA